MAEKLRYLDVRVHPSYHELVIQFADHGVAEAFGDRLTSAGVAQRLRGLADRIERVCSENPGGRGSRWNGRT